MHNIIAFVFLKDEPNSEIKSLKDAVEHVESEIIDMMCGERGDYDFGTTDLYEINDRWKEFIGCEIKNSTIESKIGQTIIKKLIDEYKTTKCKQLESIRKTLDTKSDKELLNNFSLTLEMHSLSSDYDCTVRDHNGFTIPNFIDLDRILSSKGWVVFVDVHY